jgi:hypothetical protein
MDPVVAAFGTALVGAIATDAWQQVHEAVTSLWRRVYPRREDDGIGAELDLLRADPALAVELQRVLDQVLTPALTPAEQARVGTIIMTGSSHDASTFTQIGTQTNYNRP